MDVLCLLDTLYGVNNIKIDTDELTTCMLKPNETMVLPKRRKSFEDKINLRYIYILSSYLAESTPLIGRLVNAV